MHMKKKSKGRRKPSIQALKGDDSFKNIQISETWVV